MPRATPATASTSRTTSSTTASTSAFRAPWRNDAGHGVRARPHLPLLRRRVRPPATAPPASRRPTRLARSRAGRASTASSGSPPGGGFRVGVRNRDGARRGRRASRSRSRSTTASSPTASGTTSPSATTGATVRAYVDGDPVGQAALTDAATTSRRRADGRRDRERRLDRRLRRARDLPGRAARGHAGRATSPPPATPAPVPRGQVQVTPEPNRVKVTWSPGPQPVQVEHYVIAPAAPRRAVGRQRHRSDPGGASPPARPHSPRARRQRLRHRPGHHGTSRRGPARNDPLQPGGQRRPARAVLALRRPLRDACRRCLRGDARRRVHPRRLRRRGVELGVPGALANEDDRAFGHGTTYLYYGAWFSRRFSAPGCPPATSRGPSRAGVRFDRAAWLAQWGEFGVGAEGRALLIQRRRQRPRIPFDALELNDRRWHHVAVTYDGPATAATSTARAPGASTRRPSSRPSRTAR